MSGAKPFEVYGFVGSLGSVVAYAIYLIWAYTPESWLHAVGITYYPSRYWAVAVPVYASIATLFTVIVYISLNLMATPSTVSPYTLYDEYSRPGRDSNAPVAHLKTGERPVIPSFSDMSIMEVNTLLFGHCSSLNVENET